MKLLYWACAPRRFWGAVDVSCHNGRCGDVVCLGRALPSVVWLSLLWGRLAASRAPRPLKGAGPGPGRRWCWRPRSSASGHRDRRAPLAPPSPGLWAWPHPLHAVMLGICKRRATPAEFEASTSGFLTRVRYIFFVAIVLIPFTSW
jgi:hypothetical protein